MNKEETKKKMFLHSIGRFLEKKKLLKKGLVEKQEHLMAKNRHFMLEKFSFNTQLSIAFPYLSKYLTEKIHEK